VWDSVLNVYYVVSDAVCKNNIREDLCDERFCLVV